MEKTDTKKNVTIVTVLGMCIMSALVLSVFTPFSQFAGYSLFVGLGCFFLVEWMDKTPSEESGLRFSTFLTDLKKCSPLLWLVLPVVSSVGSIIVGKLLFQNMYVDHVMGRTGTILDYSNLLVLIPEMIIAALGEEIAFRGFFTGRGMKMIGFWPAALISSVVFALAHLSTGNNAVVIFDLVTIFIDAIIYANVYRKSGNCLISTVSHLIINAAGLIIVFAFF